MASQDLISLSLKDPPNTQKFGGIESLIQVIDHCDDHNSLQVFNQILNQFINLTGSKYGFIGEPKYTKEGIPFLKYWVITPNAWDDCSEEFQEKYNIAYINENIEVHNMNTLIGLVMSEYQIVISNDIQKDNRRGGCPQIPKGHFKINNFMGIPLFFKTEFIGMIG